MMISKKWKCGSILLFSLAFATVMKVHGQDVEYLYGYNHYPVKEYTGEDKAILKLPSPKPKVIEFYSPHCVSSQSLANDV